MANRLYNKQVSPKGYKAGGSVKEDPMRDRKKQPLRTKSGGTKGKPNLFDPAFKSKKRKTEGFKMGGRAKKMGGGMMMQRPMMQKGGSLKPVQPNQKGLSKLPTEVRNKMGYMKKGGEVKKLMTPKERAEYVKKAKVSLGATAESLMDKNQPKKRDRLFQKYGK